MSHTILLLEGTLSSLLLSISTAASAAHAHVLLTEPRGKTAAAGTACRASSYRSAAASTLPNFRLSSADVSGVNAAHAACISIGEMDQSINEQSVHSMRGMAWRMSHIFCATVPW